MVRTKQWSQTLSFLVVPPRSSLERLQSNQRSLCHALFKKRVTEYTIRDALTHEGGCKKILEKNVTLPHKLPKQKYRY